MGRGKTGAVLSCRVVSSVCDLALDVTAVFHTSVLSITLNGDTHILFISDISHITEECHNYKYYIKSVILYPKIKSFTLFRVLKVGMLHLIIKPIFYIFSEIVY